MKINFVAVSFIFSKSVSRPGGLFKREEREKEKKSRRNSNYIEQLSSQMWLNFTRTNKTSTFVLKYCVVSQQHGFAVISSKKGVKSHAVMVPYT